jgi:hypothetical protein
MVRQRAIIAPDGKRIMGPWHGCEDVGHPAVMGFYLMTSATVLELMQEQCARNFSRFPQHQWWGDVSAIEAEALCQRAISGNRYRHLHHEEISVPEYFGVLTISVGENNFCDH